MTTDTDIDSLIQNYAETIKEACCQGFRKVRYEKGVDHIMLREDYSLAQYLYENSTSQSVSVLLATQTKPYIQEGDQAEEPYVMNQYYITLKGEDIQVEGLTAAALSVSIAIGMKNGNWTEDTYKVFENKPKNKSSRVIEVLYAFHPIFFTKERFVEWADVNLPPKIEECGILPMKKEIQLADHHGKDVLKRLAKRLVCESYVKGILNSIDRNPKEKNFISGINENIVYITLVNEGGFGMAVSTTARNVREARYIAKLIEKKFR
ncbi:MAG: hypothetical protein E7098_02495 [Mediterranea massiliensis]|nr:hypothetical protein [Mediterranea massiliensis]